MLLLSGIVLALAGGRAAAQSSRVQRMLDDGQDAFARGDYDDAAAQWDRAIVTEPHSIEAVYFAKRADVFLLAKDYAAGLAWIESTAEPNRPGDPLILEKKALLLDRVGKHDAAAQLADKLVISNGRAYALQLLLGDHYFALGKAGSERASKAYRAFLDARPDSLKGGDAMIRVKLGYALLQVGLFAAAKDELDRAIDTGPGHVDTNRAAKMGLCAAQAGLEHWQQTITACKLALDAGRDEPSLRDNLAVAYMRLSQIDQARKQVDAYAALRPDTVRTHTLRGDVEVAAGSLDAAGAAYQRAAAMKPDDPGLALRVGRLSLRYNPPRLPEAAKALERARKAYPERVDVLLALAETYQRMGRLGEATALALDGAARPDLQPGVKAQLLVIAADAQYSDGKDLDGALKNYEAAVTSDASNAQARDGAVATVNRLALAQLAQKAAPSAVRTTLGRALVLDPDSAMTRLNMAALLIADGQYADALPHLQKAQAKAPGDARVSWAMAKAQLGMNKPADAEKSYKEAIAAAQKDKDAVMVARLSTELGGVLVEADRADDALAAVAPIADANATEQTRRIRAVAYLHRGIDRLHAGQNGGALDDLDHAAQGSSKWLDGDEPRVLAFSRAVAKLRLGGVKDARAALEQLSAQVGDKGVAWLMPPYDKLGIEYYLALTYYREDSMQAHLRGLRLFEKLAARATGTLGTRVKTLQRASYELIAYEYFQGGNLREAKRQLDAARQVKLPGYDPVLAHNSAVLDAMSDIEGARRALEALGDDPPEALVNRGILAANQGKALEAYRLWKVALAKGARGPLQEWMQAIERILGAPQQDGT